MTHVTAMSDQDVREIRELFLRQADAETAHDIDALDNVLIRPEPGQSDSVAFVARAYRFWGRDAVMEHFRKTFAGTWTMQPDTNEIRIVPITGDVAQIYAPCSITIGASGKPANTMTFLINEFAVRTREGWKISAIVVVPAQ
jgi:ketosteroid isomerase-like protein